MTSNKRKYRAVPTWFAFIRPGLRELYYRLPLPESFKRKIYRISYSFIFNIFKIHITGERAAGPYSALLKQSVLAGMKNPEIPLETLKSMVLRVRSEEKPAKVSVIIPVYNKLHYTKQCIASIFSHMPIVDFEIIVVDDCSTDETSQYLKTIRHIQVVSNTENKGFIESCNAGAKKANGQYLCFLNNDTLVLPEWLDRLVDVFEQHENVGVVGSMLVYPDGRLQEAGGIVWRDGSAWNYGRLEHPDAPRFNYLREADYVSGASLMTSKELWNEIGGFDNYFSPAYYEDTDYCFKTRQRGLRVIYQPLSAVLHFEGISSGTDDALGIKKFQSENKIKFNERWKQVLAKHRQNAVAPELEKERKIKKRILSIDAAVLTPDMDAGSQVNYSYLLIFQKLGYKVTFIADSLQYNDRYTKNLQAEGIECIYYPFFSSVNEYLRKHLKDFEAVFISRPYIAGQYINLIRRISADIPIIYNSCDLHYLREQRQAELENSVLVRQRAERTKKQELSVIGKANCTIVVSQVEKDLLEKELPGARVELIQLIVREEPSGPGLEDRKDILFIGGFKHPPNVDAVKYFVHEVMPKLRKEIPGITLNILGSYPSQELLDLTDKDINVTGWLEDISGYFNSCIAMVVPIRYGAGIKGKIGTAFSYGLPVISTTLGAEGMELANEHDVLIANSLDEWVAAIKRLSTDQTLWKKLSENGRKIVREKYSFDVVTKQVDLLLRSHATSGYSVDDLEDEVAENGTK